MGSSLKELGWDRQGILVGREGCGLILQSLPLLLKYISM